MITPEELLQEKLEQLEAGLPFEVCAQGLPESETELLKVAVMLRKASYPARNQVTAAAQRASLLKTASEGKPMSHQNNPSFLDTLIMLLSGWLQQATLFSGAIAVLLVVAIGLGLWATVANWTAEPTPEVNVIAESTEEGSTPESVAAVNTLQPTPTTAVPTTLSPIEATSSPAYHLNIPLISVSLVQNPQSATIKQAQGLVEVQNSEGAWTVVSSGTPLFAGQRIRTGKLSNATLAFYDGSQATLSADSELSIDELDARTSDGPRVVVLTQWLGESDHQVATVSDPGRYEVRTPSGSGTAKGTAFHVLVTPNQLAYFIVLEGSVAVTNINITVIVIAGQVIIINPGQAPGDPYFSITGEGIVTEMGAAWVIGGHTFQTTENTVVRGEPQIGDWVFVEGHLLSDGTQVADRIILLQPTPDDDDFTLTGEVESISDVIWTVAGQAIVVNGATQIEDDIEVGDLVRVRGSIIPGGTLLAEHVRRLESDGMSFRFTGTVQEITAETWTISSRNIAINEATEIEAGIILGDVVEVEGRVLEDGRWLAHQIQKSDDNVPTFEFSGIVQTIDPWQVSGISFETREWTDIEPGIVVGDLVRVEGRIREDGSWVAAEIEHLDDDDDNILITFIGIVNSIDPWVVSNIPLAVDENTLIADGIEVGTRVRVHATILPDGTWLAVRIRPINQWGGCFDLSVVILGVNGNEIQVSNWSPIILDGNIIVNGELAPDNIILLRICFRNGTLIIIHIIVIYIPIIIIIQPPVPQPVPQPPPPGDEGGQVTICHKDKNTLTVPQSALGGHLGHGDTLGPCGGGGGGDDDDDDD